jgi:hypothetical protein
LLEWFARTCIFLSCSRAGQSSIIEIPSSAGDRFACRIPIATGELRKLESADFGTLDELRKFC